MTVHGDAFNLVPAYLWSDIAAWFSAWPRAMGMLAMLPMFRKELLPRLLRIALIAALCLPLTPLLKVQMAAFDADVLSVVMIIIKEIGVGFAFGLPLAMTFWIAEGIGTLLDNQSGSLISSVLNPMSGNDAATLGLFLHQIFITYFLLAGGLSWCIGSLYDSYRLWPMQSFWPQFSGVGMQWWLDQFSRYVEMLLVLAAPIVLVLFFIELGFGIIGRFAPKMQVFVLAMPVKNVVSVAMLFIYIGVLLGQFDQLMSALKDSLLHTVGALR
jgi:type III secretion protein T